MAPPSTVAGAPLSELKRSLPIPLERLLVPHRSPNLAITGRRWRILILPTKLGPRFRSCELRNLQNLQKLAILANIAKSSILGVWAKTPKNTKKPHFWTLKKRGTIMWWLPPNYLLFRYPVWPPNHPPRGVNLGVFRTPRIRGVFQDPSREMRVSAFHRNRGFRDSACFAFCTEFGIPDSGFCNSKFHHPVIPSGLGVAENWPPQISGIRTLLNDYDDHACNA